MSAGERLDESDGKMVRDGGVQNQTYLHVIMMLSHGLQVVFRYPAAVKIKPRMPTVT
jgi:hypothetical protein